MKRNGALACVFALLVLGIALPGQCDHGDPNTFRVQFSTQVGLSGIKLEEALSFSQLVECQDLHGLEGDASSITWPSNGVLVVFDGQNCGGNSMVVYSSGLYKAVQLGGYTRDAGFEADSHGDLRTVCKFDRCGYSSTAYSKGFPVRRSTPPGAVLLAEPVGRSPDMPSAMTARLAWDQCACEETWDKCIRSYRVFRRSVMPTTMDVV